MSQFSPSSSPSESTDSVSSALDSALEPPSFSSASVQSLSQQWFVPLSQLRQVGGAELMPWESVHSSSIPGGGHDNVQAPSPDLWIEPGSPVTLSLESFCINEALDRRSGNDLLVRSWTIYGDAPPVEMIHCFERNATVGKVIDNLAIEHMFAVEAFNPSPALTVYLQILEVDGHDSLEDELLNVAQALGRVFPTLLPFTTVSIPLYKQLKSMFAKQERTVEAFAGRFQLSGWVEHGATDPARPEASGIQAGASGLRAGAYVMCREPVEGQAYRLQDLKLVPAQEDGPNPPSYAVIKVVPQLVQSYNPADLLVNQKLAAALLNPTHADELQEPAIIQSLKQKVKALPYLQAAAQKAMLLDDLQEYRDLMQLQKAETNTLGGHPPGTHDPEFQRDRLLRLERIRLLKTRLAQNAFLPAIAHLIHSRP